VSGGVPQLPERRLVKCGERVVAANGLGGKVRARVKTIDHMLLLLRARIRQSSRPRPS